MTAAGLALSQSDGAPPSEQPRLRVRLHEARREFDERRLRTPAWRAIASRKRTGNRHARVAQSRHGRHRIDAITQCPE